MAVMPLMNPIEWGYDDGTGEIVVRMRERVPDGHPDPVSYVPTREAIVRLVVASITVNDLTPEPPP